MRQLRGAETRKLRWGPGLVPHLCEKCLLGCGPHVVGLRSPSTLVRAQVVRHLVAFPKRLIAGALHICSMKEQIVAVGLLSLGKDEPESAVADELLDGSTCHRRSTSGRSTPVHLAVLPARQALMADHYYEPREHSQGSAPRSFPLTDCTAICRRDARSGPRFRPASRAFRRPAHP